MTIGSRNALYQALFILSSCITLVLSYTLLSNGQFDASVLILQSIISIILSRIIFQYFSKTANTEIQFLHFFLLSGFFQLLPDFAQILEGNVPFLFIIWITRVFVFFRLFSYFSLLCAGFFSSGMEYQRFNIVIGIIVLTAAMVSMVIPIDPSQGTAQGLYLLVHGDLLQLLLQITLIFTVLNFIIAAIKNQEIQYFFTAIALIILFIGINFPEGDLPIKILGSICYLGGAGLFANRIYVMNLWR
jgi:hypothetical protein